MKLHFNISIVLGLNPVITTASKFVGRYSISIISFVLGLDAFILTLGRVKVNAKCAGSVSFWVVATSLSTLLARWYVTAKDSSVLNINCMSLIRMTLRAGSIRRINGFRAAHSNRTISFKINHDFSVREGVEYFLHLSLSVLSGHWCFKDHRLPQKLKLVVLVFKLQWVEANQNP